MPRMSAEKRFKAQYPRATIETQRERFGRTYYLVRKRYGANMWTGSGDTRAQAWADACRAVGLDEPAAAAAKGEDTKP